MSAIGNASDEVGLGRIGLIRVPAWSGFKWLWHGFSTRRCGVSRAYLPVDRADDPASGELNLGFTATDEAENVRENRSRLVVAASGGQSQRDGADGLAELVTIRQVHSAVSVMATDGGMPAEADGVMTDRAGLLLGIQTADCIPVLVADPVRRAVAGFHAGWRGTAGRIVELGVAKMREEFGSDPAELVAATGPGIGRCCYTVGEELRREFRDRFAYADELFLQDGEELRLDLIEANRRQLLDAGLPAKAISVVGGCTSCQPELFFSHRASRGHAGRMMAVIGIRPES